MIHNIGRDGSPDAVLYTEQSLTDEQKGRARQNIDAVEIAVVNTSLPQVLEDNTIYNLEDVNTLAIAYPSGDFDCIINLTTAESGTITITFPTSTYIPSVPTFGNGEIWSIWIRNNPFGDGGIVTAQKAAMVN